MEKKSYHKSNRFQVGVKHQICNFDAYLPILKQCFIHGALTGEEIRQAVAQNAKRGPFSKKLNILVSHPNLYLRKPKEQFDRYKPELYHLVYQITPKGLDVLVDHSVITPKEKEWHSLRPHANYWHDRLTSYVTSSLEAWCRANGERFIPWNEMIALAPAKVRAQKTPFHVNVGNVRIIPDAICGKEGPEGFQHFTIEADRDTEGIPFVIDKLRDYITFYERRAYINQWDVRSMQTIFVTLKHEHCIKLLERFSPERRLRPFVFKAEPAFAKRLGAPRQVFDDHLFREPFYCIDEQSREITTRLVTR